MREQRYYDFLLAHDLRGAENEIQKNGTHLSSQGSASAQPALSKDAARSLSPQMSRYLTGKGYQLDRMRVVGKTMRLGPYLRALFERRHFIVAGARGHTMTRHQNDRLGSLWLVLRPVLDAAFFYIIFHLVLQISRGMDNYIAFLLIGVFMFQYSSRCINAGSALIRNSRGMIRSFNFPRASLAVSAVARELMMSVPAFLVLVVLIMALPPHELPTWSWLLFPVVLLLQTLMNLGLVLLLARLGVVFPDLTQLVSFVLRVLMYASGVIFPVSRFEHIELFAVLVQFNPMHTFLTMYRAILMDGAVPALSAWMSGGAWALGALAVGFLVFWKAEVSYGRD